MGKAAAVKQENFDSYEKLRARLRRLSNAKYDGSDRRFSSYNQWEQWRDTQLSIVRNEIKEKNRRLASGAATGKIPFEYKEPEFVAPRAGAKKFKLY